MQLILAISALLAIFAGIPLLMFAMMRGARNYSGRFRNAVGHALEDLDRHTVRPSLENKIEHEMKVVYQEDEHRGE